MTSTDDAMKTLLRHIELSLSALESGGRATGAKLCRSSGRQVAARRRARLQQANCVTSSWSTFANGRDKGSYQQMMSADGIATDSVHKEVDGGGSGRDKLGNNNNHNFRQVIQKATNQLSQL